MKVLLVSHEYPPETAWGGIGTYAGTLAPALAEAGAEVHVLAAGGVEQRSTVVRDGVRVHRAPVAGATAGRLSRLPETWRRVSLAATVARERARLAERFDVCEVPDWGGEAAALRMRGCALVVRLHSGAAQLFPFTGRMGVDRRLAVRIEHAPLRRADVVTASPVQAAYARDALGIEESRLREVTYPVSPVEAGEAEVQDEVLFLGRLEARKGPDLLIRALPGLIARVPGARLTLAGVDTGATSYRAQLERLAQELGVREHVVVEPVWGRDAVRERLRRAAVVAVPSRWESFGYTAAEAMSAGRAVAASAIPAFEELIRDGVTGTLVETESPTAWSDGLAALLEDAGRTRRIGVAAREHIAQRHAPALVAARTLEVYEQAVATRRG